MPGTEPQGFSSLSATVKWGLKFTGHFTCYYVYVIFTVSHLLRFYFGLDWDLPDYEKLFKKAASSFNRFHLEIYDGAINKLGLQFIFLNFIMNIVYLRISPFFRLPCSF